MGAYLFVVTSRPAAVDKALQLAPVADHPLLHLGIGDIESGPVKGMRHKLALEDLGELAEGLVDYGGGTQPDDGLEPWLTLEDLDGSIVESFLAAMVLHPTSECTGKRFACTTFRDEHGGVQG
jgi:hypothetical protein